MRTKRKSINNIVLLVLVGTIMSCSSKPTMKNDDDDSGYGEATYRYDTDTTSPGQHGLRANEWIHYVEGEPYSIPAEVAGATMIYGHPQRGMYPFYDTLRLNDSISYHVEFSKSEAASDGPLGECWLTRRKRGVEESSRNIHGNFYYLFWTEANDFFLTGDGRLQVDGKRVSTGHSGQYIVRLALIP